MAFIVEKLTLISEILPVQVALKTMSPVVFGGLVPGALVAASCETFGATVNFFIGRSFFFERLRDFQLPGEPKLGEAAWFARRSVMCHAVQFSGWRALQRRRASR